MPFLNMRVDAGLVALDPEVTHGAIVLPVALMDAKLSVRFCQGAEKFLFIDPYSAVLDRTGASFAPR